MNIIMLSAVLLMGLLQPCSASWQGKLDLTPTVQPMMIRELHDGQWLYGIAKNNLWHLDYNNPSGSFWNGQRFHAGAFQAWNAESGNGSFGLVAGFDIPAPIGKAIASGISAVGLEQTAKFLSHVGEMLSVDFLGGYRPIHTNAVNDDWVYGVGASLSIQFGVSDLKEGL